MSRTAHHTTNNHRSIPCWSGFSCWSGHEMTDLRYSNDELRRALRQGRRPQPEFRRHRFAAYVYPRASNVAAIGVCAYIERRRNRSHDRQALIKLRRIANTAASKDYFLIMDDEDTLFNREFHNAIWNAS